MNEQGYPPLPPHEAIHAFMSVYTADQMRDYAAAAIAQQATRHSEELLAAEITIGKLREQNDTAISVVSRLLQVHEDRSIEDATNLAYAMLSAAPAPEPERKPTTVYEALLRDGREKRAKKDAPQAQPERKPMTEEQLELLYRENSGYGGDDFNSFARAIEAFHGIKEKP